MGCNSGDLFQGVHWAGYAAAVGVVVVAVAGFAFPKVMPSRMIGSIVGWLLAIMLASRTLPEVLCSRQEPWTIHLTIQCVSLSIVLLLAGWGTYRWVKPSRGKELNTKS